MGYELIKHAIQALNINVVLVMGDDKLYAMISSHYNKLRDQKQKGDINFNVDDKTALPKVIKLPRSGGVVSRDSGYRRISRTLCMKQYFYGNSIVPSSTYSSAASNMSMNMNTAAAAAAASSTSDGISISTSSLVHQYSPSLIELSFSDVNIYQISNVSLTASMLPVSAKQSSEAVQLTPIVSLGDGSVSGSVGSNSGGSGVGSGTGGGSTSGSGGTSGSGTNLVHCMLAVCHPAAVERYKLSGEARDLYMAGVTGFVVVEKVDVSREIISLLSPCAGSLASSTLLLAEITWRE